MIKNFLLTALRNFSKNKFYTFINIAGLSIGIETAPGDKCERCWVHDTSVGANADHPKICTRCQDALSKIN